MKTLIESGESLLISSVLQIAWPSTILLHAKCLLSFSSVISLTQYITLFRANTWSLNWRPHRNDSLSQPKGTKLALNPRGGISELQKVSSLWHCPPDDTHSHPMKGVWEHIPVCVSTDILSSFVSLLNVINDNKSTCHFN